MSVITNNQNILKYLYYLKSPNPLLEDDIQEDLVEKGIIIPAPFDPNILDEQEARLFINPYEGNLRKLPLSNLIYLLEIVIPINVNIWTLPGLGKLRIFRIADEFARKVDQQKVAGITDVVIEQFKLFKQGDKFGGITLWVSINSNAMKGMRKND